MPEHEEADVEVPLPRLAIATPGIGRKACREEGPRWGGGGERGDGKEEEEEEEGKEEVLGGGEPGPWHCST